MDVRSSSPQPITARDTSVLFDAAWAAESQAALDKAAAEHEVDPKSAAQKISAIIDKIEAREKNLEIRAAATPISESRDVDMLRGEQIALDRFRNEMQDLGLTDGTLSEEAATAFRISTDVALDAMKDSKVYEAVYNEAFARELNDYISSLVMGIHHEPSLSRICKELGLNLAPRYDKSVSPFADRLLDPERSSRPNSVFAETTTEFIGRNKVHVNITLWSQRGPWKLSSRLARNFGDFSEEATELISDRSQGLGIPAIGVDLCKRSRANPSFDEISLSIILIRGQKLSKAS